MKTVKVKAYLVCHVSKYGGEPELKLWPWKYEDDENVTLGEYEIECDVPKWADLSAKLVANIRQAKKEAELEHIRNQNAFNDRIQKLLALPHIIRGEDNDDDLPS